jgi:cytochrome oxidase Cu insertion factor (SCO1/SenC/PrrC family)
MISRQTIQTVFFFCLLFLLSNRGNAQETPLSHYDSLSTMPPFKFYNLKGEAFTPDSLKKGTHRVVLIYFKTSCEFCLSEFKLIKHGMRDYPNTQFILISREEPEALKAYDSLRQFSHFPQIRVLEDRNRLYHTYFEAHYTPSIHVYDENYKLIRFLDGMLNKEELVKYLK